MGLVSQIFNGEILHDLVGHMAVGHTRYSTTGSSQLRNAQPLDRDCERGQIAIAHNGNLTNAARLREELEEHAAPFSRPPSTAKSSCICSPSPTPTAAKTTSCKRSARTRRRLFAGHHDRTGIDRRARSLRLPSRSAWARLGDAWVLASETCALDLISAKFVRDIEPGEIVIIDKNGLRSIQAFPEQQRARLLHF